ncbi:MAG TPA: recombination-associated protein RdgC [Woeseiaceae bacterium]|nr:recombination-associated protein RdgC [Woeseiaceae bacterium]
MFRNVRFYRIGDGWPNSEEEVTQALRAAEFKPCGPLTERSSGWVAIYPDAGDALARRVNGADLIRMRSQSRVLPPSVIKEELDVRIDDYAARMKEAPSASEKRRMKAEARDELMPKAMLRSDRTWGFVDLKENLIGIDALQASVAERFLRRLGAAMPISNLRPLQFNQPVGELLTRIFLGDAPRQFAVGRECRMQDSADAGSKVRWSQFDLSEKSIRNHVTDGMRLTHLAIEYDNILSCVIDQDGTLGKLRFLGMDDDHGDELDPLARLDAEFVLMSGTLRQMMTDLKKLLNGFA